VPWRYFNERRVLLPAVFECPFTAWSKRTGIGFFIENWRLSFDGKQFCAFLLIDTWKAAK
jgi:hypothetical protein